MQFKLCHDPELKNTHFRSSENEFPGDVCCYESGNRCLSSRLPVVKQNDLERNIFVAQRPAYPLKSDVVNLQ